MNRKRRVILGLGGMLLSVGAFFGLIVGGIYFLIAHDLPALDRIEDYRPSIVSQILTLPEGQTEPTVIGEFSIERRYLVTMDKIPKLLIGAFTSAEDDQFFQHHGFNPTAIFRAAMANLRAGHVVQGGSTITQQVAKSILLTPEKSLDRKLKELLVSWKLESTFSKEQILYLYLNQIYLGQGAYGVEAAARSYFRKSVQDLNLAESAILAGLPQAPSKYSPYTNSKRAKERQLYVLRRMVETGVITEAERKDAAERTVRIYTDPDINSTYSPYYVEHLRRYVAEKYGDERLYRDGLKIWVRAHPDSLKSARKAIQNGLMANDKREGYRGAPKNIEENQRAQELARMRDRAISRKIGFQVLTPEGELSLDAAVREMKWTSSAESLIRGEVYQALVIEVDDKKKRIVVDLGILQAELLPEGYLWARKHTPSAPSKLFKVGDLIEVRVDSIEQTFVKLSLEQTPELQGAVLSVDAQTGFIQAFEGGFDYQKSQFNRTTQALRQPGSAYKPFIFTAALEKGMTPVSIIVDAPITYEDEEFGKWKPSNFENKFYGDTTLRSALIRSRNIPTIKIVQSVGVASLLDFTKRIGLQGTHPHDLSISLGSSSVSLAELTQAYCIFPRLGKKLTLRYFDRIEDRDGNVLETTTPQTTFRLQDWKKAVEAWSSSLSTTSASPTTEGEGLSPTEVKKPLLPPYPMEYDSDQVIDPRVAYVATHLMKEVVHFGTGYEAKALGRPVAGKTGTTNDYFDAWFMGFTPQVVTGVWVGYDAQKSMGSGETGARAALPIWLSVMEEVLKRYPEADFEVPPGVTFVNIHAATGKLTRPNAPQSIREAFVAGTEPREEDASSREIKTQVDLLKEDIE
jgi:penicillin-binding protein 1A